MGLARGPSALACVLVWTLALFAAGAQTILPSPGNQSPDGLENAKIAYTIERGMPYSGIWITKHVTTFPDGQIKNEENTRKVWRDSDGRTREEVTWTRFNGAIATVYRVEDPVAKVRHIWRVEPNRKVIVTETHFSIEKYAVTEVWPNPPSHMVENPPGATVVILSAAPRVTRRPDEHRLGPIYLNGLYAEGVRTVEPLPSDPTRHRVDEVWSAPDLNLVIKTYLEDGNGFIEDSELKNIDRSEPDPSLFIPPSGLPRREAPESDPAWHETYGAD